MDHTPSTVAMNFGPQRTQLHLEVNGQSRPVDVEPRTTLLDVLREQLDLTGDAGLARASQQLFALEPEGKLFGRRALALADCANGAQPARMPDHCASCRRLFSSAGSASRRAAMIPCTDSGTAGASAPRSTTIRTYSWA